MPALFPLAGVRTKQTAQAFARLDRYDQKDLPQYNIEQKLLRLLLANEKSAPCNVFETLLML